MGSYRLKIHTNDDVKMFNNEAYIFQGSGFDKHVRYEMILALGKVSLEPLDHKLEACHTLRKAVADMTEALRNFDGDDDLFTLLKFGGQQYIEVEACWELDGHIVG